MATPVETSANMPQVETALERSVEVMLWVNANLDGLKVPKIQTSKRKHIAAGSLHVAVEHDQAIVVLVTERLYGSALALVRPLFEAYVRGTWLMYAASDADVDRAGKDQFPAFGQMVKGLEKPELFGADTLSPVKSQWWGRLCSFTHTGYQQIGARLTVDGVGYSHQESEILNALTWADSVALVSLMASRHWLTTKHWPRVR